MAYRYIYNDSLLAEGERTVVLQNGKLYVRTGVLGTTDDQINYRLREVYDDADRRYLAMLARATAAPSSSVSDAA